MATVSAKTNIAVAAAYADWGEWRGVQLQLVVNLAAILAAGILTLIGQRWAYGRRTARRG